MLNTWNRDIQTQTAYLYDYYHDQSSSESLKLFDLHPQDDPQKTPMEIKFIRHASQTYDKDQITFWLQMQPGQQCNLDYYDTVLGKRYDAIFPIGCYVDIMGEDGIYDKWLIVDKANYRGNQFPTFEILPCDFIARWVYDEHKYQCAAVLRSQNSYNSGIWRAYKMTDVEDQQKFAVPMTRETETLWYNIRMIVDTKVETEPRAWHITKVNRISPNGVSRVTLAQDTFDQNRDYIEKDVDGNVVAMWANYWNTNIAPTPIIPDEEYSSITAKITCSGKQQIKVGGSPKTFTVSYYDERGELLPDFEPGRWWVMIDGETIGEDLFEMTNDPDNIYKVKIKFLGDDDYIGKTLTVRNRNNDIVADIEVAIIAL